MEIFDRRVTLLAKLISSPRPIAVVPTMGGLHEGHLSLVRKARETAKTLVVSVFVNPLQFGEMEDYESYPRDLEADVAKLEGMCDCLFAPTLEEMYPSDQTVRISLPPLAGELCGASRPDHFGGVAVLVSKLLNLTRPDAMMFGKKDYQQFVLMRALAEQLDYPVRILAGEIVREEDGLAMSSRNAYLTADEREKAPALHRTLKGLAGAVGVGEGPVRIGQLLADGKRELEQLGFVPDYIEVRAAKDLSQPKWAAGERVVVLGAATLGKCRLIDNFEAKRAG